MPEPNGAPIGAETGGSEAQGALPTPGIAVPEGITPGSVPPISPTFNIGGAPIALLGGVFSEGLPIAGPVTQLFRGGGGAQPNTLFIATISPSGPIGTFLIGGGGGPIGTASFGRGGLPIGATPAVEREVEILGPRTALVGATLVGGAPSPPAVFFGTARAGGSSPPIGQ